MQDNLKKSKQGGKRIGAGRPAGRKNTVKKNTTISLQQMVLDDAVKKILPKGKMHKGIIREQFAKHVEENVKPIFDAYFDLGINKGEVRALDTLLGYAWGKPTQAIDLNANIKLSLADLAVEASKLSLEDQPTYREIEPTQSTSDEK